MPQIVHAHAAPLLESARRLFAEYAASIARVAACSLEHQGFDAELATLPGLYAPPTGCMLLAIHSSAPDSPALYTEPPDHTILGCIALRPLPKLGPAVCEMKRMYVRPAARRLGLGIALGDRLIAEARAAGYKLMKLDTSDTMLPAIALYRSLGFVECPRYNDDPMTDTVWLDKPL